MINLNSKTKTIVLSFALILSGLFFACSNDPSGKAKRLLENQINEYSSGKIKLLSFTKKNGTNGEESGVKKCKVEYSATIEFLEDCWQDNFASPYSVQKMRMGVNQMETYRRKGEKRTINNYMVLEKTDNGWRIDQ